MVAGALNIVYFMPPISIGDNGDFKGAVVKALLSTPNQMEIIKTRANHKLRRRIKRKIETAFPSFRV